MTSRLSAFFGAPHWPTVALTYAIGTSGGVVAMLAHLPLPMLLGSLLAVGAAALFGLRPLGRLPEALARLRLASQHLAPDDSSDMAKAIRNEISRLESTGVNAAN